MDRLRWSLRLAIWLGVLSATSFAQNNDITLQGGGGLTGRHDVNLPLNLGTVRLQENNGYAAGIVYGRKLAGGEKAALWLQIPVFAVQARTPGVDVFDNTTGVAGFLTPDAQVKLFPRSRVSPYGFFGAGYARVVDVGIGSLSPFRSRVFDNGTWALTYGGGVDVKVVRWFGIRGEVRGFYTGSNNFPAIPELSSVPLQTPSTAGNLDRRNTAIATVGLQFRF